MKTLTLGILSLIGPNLWAACITAPPANWRAKLKVDGVYETQPKDQNVAVQCGVVGKVASGKKKGTKVVAWAGGSPEICSAKPGEILDVWVGHECCDAGQAACNAVWIVGNEEVTGNGQFLLPAKKKR